MSGVAAGVKAGYALTTAQTGRLHKRLGDDIAIALEKSGFTNQFVSDKIMQKVESKNESVGHKYFETGLKLTRKLIPDAGSTLIDKMQVNVYLPANPPQELT